MSRRAEILFSWKSTWQINEEEIKSPAQVWRVTYPYYGLNVRGLKTKRVSAMVIRSIQP
jgi:hypothetical protein